MGARVRGLLLSRPKVLSRKLDHYYSPKRTFDLCLFSEEEIVILEAKAQQPFESRQVEHFCTDRAEVKKITGVKTVWLAGLASSKYKPTDGVEKKLDGPMMKWRDLAEIYEDDKILARADELYDDRRTWGKHNDGGYRTGSELMKLHEEGVTLYVGRKGNLNGTVFREDLRSGRWETHGYETSHRGSPPSGNWFC